MFEKPCLLSKISLLALFAGLAAVPAWGDQIVMKNGDRVTGAVVKKDGNAVTVKTDQFGSVSLAWDQIASIDERINRST